MPPLHLIIQDSLLRGRPLGDLDGTATVITTTADWQNEILRLDDELARDCRPVVFASIQVCSFIYRKAPRLARGVIADFEKCRFSRSMALVPQGIALNDSYILLPFGEIIKRKPQLRSLFGDRIFLRPDDSRKSFTGFSVALDRLDFEISSLRQIHNTHDDELCVVDRQRDIRRSEYRFWLIAGEVATMASYSHYGGQSRNVPDVALSAASDLAAHMELYNDTAVADFAIDPAGRPRLIEINAVSTSGIYPGADLNRLVAALDQIII